MIRAATLRAATIRATMRWLHIALAVPIVGYIYSPFAMLPSYATPTRYVFLPAMLLSGLWMWKGQSVWRWATRPRADRA